MLAPASNAISLSRSLTFAKLTVLLVRRIIRSAIINAIAPQRFGDAVFSFAALKLILTIRIRAHFRPNRPKSALSHRLIGQYKTVTRERCGKDASWQKKKKNNLIVFHRQASDKPDPHIVVLRQQTPVGVGLFLTAKLERRRRRVPHAQHGRGTTSY